MGGRLDSLIKEVRLVSVYEAINIMISFATLIILILKFGTKK